MNILVVDDAPEILAWLTAILSRNGWTVYQASDGDSACEILAQHDIRLVLTDWMMPGMNGITLVERIRQQSEHYVYTILMTARNDDGDNIFGLQSGADDYLVKPVPVGVLNARLAVAKRILDSQNTLERQKTGLLESRRDVNRALRTYRKQLKQAADQQFSALPDGKALPRGVYADWRFKPARSLSGDHLDFFLVNEHKLGFYLLDVSGHGITAALRSAALAELLKPFGPMMQKLCSKGPANVLEKLNRHICSSSEEVEYLATLVLGTLDTQSGEVHIASAGHPCPLLTGIDHILRDVLTNGLPLGIDPDARFDNYRFHMAPGDTLLLFSDGVTDCTNAHGEQFGSPRLRSELRSLHPGKQELVVPSIQRLLKRWRGSTRLNDDLTLLAIGLTANADLNINVNSTPPAWRQSA